MWQCDSSKLRKREVGTFVRQPSVFAPVSMLAACLFLALTCPIPKRNHRKCGPVSHMSSRIMVSGCCPVHQVTCDSLCSGPLQTKRQLFCPKSSTYIGRKCRKRIGKNSKIVVTDPQRSESAAYKETLISLLQYFLSLPRFSESNCLRHCPPGPLALPSRSFFLSMNFQGTYLARCCKVGPSWRLDSLSSSLPVIVGSELTIVNSYRLFQTEFESLFVLTKCIPKIQ